MRAIAVILVAWGALASTGCPADELECAQVDSTCSPLYEPTFANVYANTLVPSCAVSGGACHDANGGKGGLVITDIDSTYEALTGTVDGEPRVVPFDVECSPVSKRINALRASDVMPPGDPLSAAERCAVEQWIADGAQR